MYDEKYIEINKKFNDTHDVPKGKNVFYKCCKCNGVIPSQPKTNIGCTCGNVFIDIDYFRLAVGNFDCFQVLQKKQTVD